MENRSSLDISVLPYVHSFTNNKVNGQQLLSLRPEDLEQLGVLKVGHQEIILEAVEYLRNFHYELDRENLQLLALRLSCQAHSLHNELSRQTDSKPVTTQTLSDVVGVVTSVKPLVRWLDKPPFSGQLEYADKKTLLLKLSIEMATCAQRDRFAEKPIEEIRTTCGQLAQLADYIIQDISDPMILQPASLDLATLKKKPGDDLGFYILPSFHGTHQIAEIKFSSVAHQCGKMEEGDEIVQVNYQTVVAWERKNVLELFNESPAEVLLTLKRRPRHTKVYGQIYIKPYRLPSNKKTPYATRWQHNLPSPRPELLTIPDFTIPLPRHAPKDPNPAPISTISTVSMLDTMGTDSSDSDCEVEPPLSSRLYPSKPRALVQRRATITGASPTTKHTIDIEQFWKELKQEHSTTFQLRDKAASCAHGLDTVPTNLRPQTCLGIEQSKRKKRIQEDKKSENGITSKNNTNHNKIESASENNLSKSDGDEYAINTIIGKTNNTCDSLVFSTGKYGLPNTCTADDIDTIYPSESENYCRNDQGKLDKSHSTPPYDEIEITPVKINSGDPGNSLKDHPNCTKRIDVLKTDINVREDNLEINKTFEMMEVVRLEGHVAQKINSIEERVRESNTTDLRTNLKVSDVKDLYENNACKDLKKEQRKSEIIINDREESLVTNMIIPSETQKNANYLSNYGSSQGKSESRYMDRIHSNRSKAEALLDKFDQTSLPITENSEILDINAEEISMASMNISKKNYVTSESKENLSPKSTKLPSVIFKRDTTTGENEECEPMSRQVIECKECTKRPEINVRSTPPEPPPRRYFTKLSPLNLDANVIPPEPPERPKVTLNRSNSKRELHRIENRSNCELIVPSNQREFFEGHHDFVEKSTDFIDETSSAIRDRRALIGHFDYVESYESQIKGDKPIAEKYELFTEKFGNGNALIVQSQPEIVVRTADSPDAAKYSTQASELKTRTLEKDKHGEKGVVNRAMMVARSIGLHSASKLSSNSPRSSRKRNILLAKRRNVSVKDIGAGELEGWLTYRSRGAGGAWARSWFVLKGSSLYRFENPESLKSDCLIVLPGFTASQAPEVKSRKFAFKVYHTGTVFYFAADAEDSLSLWLDSINKATLGADSYNRTSGLFSETDDSDSESKGKLKNTGSELKPSTDKASSFGSLKKIGRKNSGAKDHEIGGASLDRKYLRFLGARTQDIPVPTAQFRSYRRVLPLTTPNQKPESTLTSPDLRIIVAGSTFYALTSSHSSTDVPTTSRDMEDYRQTTDRSQPSRCRRSEDLRGFVTLEDFMLSHQQYAHQRSMNTSSTSPRKTPLTSEHVQLQYRQHDDNHTHFNPDILTNGMIYGHPRNGEDLSPFNKGTCSYARNPSETSKPDKPESINNQKFQPINKRPSPVPKETCDRICIYEKRQQEAILHHPLKTDALHWQNVCNEMKRINSPLDGRSTHNSPNITTHMTKIDPRNESLQLMNVKDGRNREFHREDVFQSVSRKSVRENGYSGSSGDLTCCTSSDTLRRARNEAAVSRKGSFNLNDRCRDDKRWMDSLRRSDKKISAGQKARLKSVAQYQPPPIHSSPFEQDGMRAAFEMHLDKEHAQKTNRLKNFFGVKSPQKPSSLDLPKEQQKTLLGSPRLHRALFKDKSSSQKRSGSQSPGDSGISQSLSSYSGMSQSHTLSQSFSSVSSTSDWSPETPSMNADKNIVIHGNKRINTSHLIYPPTLPYIPPPSSPPPDDYPGLEYPPVFEPGTYSLSDTSLLRERCRKDRDKSQ
ncbi:uncharacterized protein LOC107044159 isoform X2 [Diachasma alloeum]|uniref:uncharacterized protein LOC107044159 isoform X2 n=1 Tax=Diachasma alloeum TaxID=454923 RepID=UPI0007382E74|nr:uncharacterized protein LOC107044159 isoform X2 [Diachasma alloeum]